MVHRLRNPSLLSIADLTRDEVQFLFRAAQSLSESFHRNETVPLLAGRTLAQLFFENSTRTRLSFETAIRRLGAGTLTFTASTSSLSKGESLLDTIRNLEAFRPDAFIVRHGASASVLHLATKTNRPLINAGDGTREHPTQALLDAFTLQQKWGTLEGKTVLILGDILHSRVARSNTRLLKLLGARVLYCGPGSLLPSNPAVLGADAATSQIDSVLPEADAVMCLRIQRERQNSPTIPSLQEYARFFGLTSERAKRLKPDAWILHPGPVNRGVEVSPELADGPSSLILEQVSNGVPMRMAILAALLNPGGLARHLDASPLSSGDSSS